MPPDTVLRYPKGALNAVAKAEGLVLKLSSERGAMNTVEAALLGVVIQLTAALREVVGEDE